MKFVRPFLLLAAVSTAAGLAPFSAAPASAEGAPTVRAVAVTSHAGADATYALGETVRVTLTFSEAVTVTGAPGLAIDMDPAAWGENWIAPVDVRVLITSNHLTGTARRLPYLTPLQTPLGSPICKAG